MLFSSWSTPTRALLFTFMKLVSLRQKSLNWVYRESGTSQEASILTPDLSSPGRTFTANLKYMAIRSWTCTTQGMGESSTSTSGVIPPPPNIMRPLWV